MRGASAAAQLLRALARRAGPGVALDHAGETPWSSATFVGAQHRILVTGDTAWTNGLDDADWTMRDCFVASIAVTPAPDGAELVVLMLEA